MGEEKKDLRKENERLQAELDRYKQKEENSKNISWWVTRKFTGVILGKNLDAAVKNTITEVSENKSVSNDTLSDLIVSLIKRFVGVGFIPFLLALSPFIFLVIQTCLLKQQNELVENQNKLFDNQNILIAEELEKVKEQTNLLTYQTNLLSRQNISISEQTDLFREETKLLRKQNKSVSEQTKLLKKQNEWVNIQTNIIESQRLSSYVFLMANVHDKIDEEIKSQEILLSNNNSPHKYKLSMPLIGRISSLSKAYQPYKVFSSERGTITKKKRSPERTLLFESLINSDLDSVTFNLIISRSDFSYANLVRGDLRGFPMMNSTFRNVNLRYGKLQKVDFRDSNLKGGDFRDAKLKNAIFNGADLTGAKFKKADLENVKMKNTILREVLFNNTKSLTYEQLLNSKCLYESEGLKTELKGKLLKNRPCLFDEKGCPDLE